MVVTILYQSLLTPVIVELTFGTKYLQHNLFVPTTVFNIELYLHFRSLLKMSKCLTVMKIQRNVLKSCREFLMSEPL